MITIEFKNVSDKTQKRIKRACKVCLIATCITTAGFLWFAGGVALLAYNREALFVIFMLVSIIGAVTTIAYFNDDSENNDNS